MFELRSRFPEQSNQINGPLADSFVRGFLFILKGFCFVFEEGRSGYAPSHLHHTKITCRQDDPLLPLTARLQMNSPAFRWTYSRGRKATEDQGEGYSMDTSTSHWRKEKQEKKILCNVTTRMRYSGSERWGEGICLISASLGHTPAMVFHFWNSTASGIPARVPADRCVLPEPTVVIREARGTRSTALIGCLADYSQE